MTNQLRRSERIIKSLQDKYPGKKTYDIDGRGEHFVCEIDPPDAHSKYDIAVEVIISSVPHKHLKTTQKYKILQGDLDLNLDGKIISLKKCDTYVILPGGIHSATSKNEAWVEIYSTPGWTQDDHIAT